MNKNKQTKLNNLPPTTYLSRSSAESRWYRDELQANKGFTLIELLISLAIIIIVTGAMLSIVRVSGTQHSLVLEANKVLGAVRSAQSYSLAIPNNDQDKICGFGFQPSADGKSYKVFYIYYTGDTADAENQGCKSNLKKSVNGDYERSDSADRWEENYELADDIEFSNGLGEAIFFSVPYGEVYKEGASLDASVINEYKYKIKSTVDNETKDIVINKYGKINLAN